MRLQFLTTTLIAFIVLIPSSARAMGGRPTELPTWEGDGITVKFVRAFGLPGKLPGQFFYPQDLSLPLLGDQAASLGNLFVADTGNDRIQRIEQDGDFMNEFGRFGTEGNGAFFNQPMGIAVDFNSRVYISDRNNHRIGVFDIWGNPLPPAPFWGGFGVGGTGMNQPAGIAVSPFGEVYVADSGNDRIIKFREDGVFLKSIGGFGVGPGFFDGPLDVAVDKNRNLYIADTGNHRIQKIDQFDRPVFALKGKGTAPGQMMYPAGVAVDEKYIYVSDTGNDRIQIFDQQGRLQAHFGKSGSRPGEFRRPQGIAAVPPNKIFVADTENHRIQEFAIIPISTPIPR